MECSPVILAAGLGTRMKSSLPKVLHALGGRPLIRWTVEASRRATGVEPYVVVGPEAEGVHRAAGEGVHFIEQAERLGTGHAVLQAMGALEGRSTWVLVTSADMPLLQADTLRRLVAAQRVSTGPMTLLTVHAEEARGFGRVLRDASGRVRGIIEAAHATPAQLAIRELNVGAYCYDAEWLWDRLPALRRSPKGEFYLTDLVAMAVDEGHTVDTVEVEDPDEAIGINTRQHLAQAEAALRQRINRGWMLAGVTMADPATTYIGPEVEIGQDTVLLPSTHLEGRTRVGSGCRLGPNAVIRASTVGDRCVVESSVVEEAEIAEEVSVGPFAHLRPGTRLGRGVHVGNFGEIKNSTLGPGVKMGHFSYLGDATVGAETNIGAGTITCNFDGERKHPTEIGEGAFIGSDTMLVAPVRIGSGARTGAGAVVTRDVPGDSLAVGMPARAIRKLDSND